MEALIVVLLIANIILAILLVVVGMARLDRKYAATVRAEYDRKSMLRGEDQRKD